ncbi:hypothetical protein GWN26_02700 [Candidatus Saccharibacteria bacterium]|nr:hypothetical protein [Calditrichia bacterium]NIV98105.1 hypothetical protein [Candidatus Saccharibacteria bacterium]NIW78386.1 hypothetical protein [Calditrichia bacterium]
MDGEGNIIVADAYNHRLQKFSWEGNPLHSWGSFSGEDRQPGQFNDPPILPLILPDGYMWLIGEITEYRN